MNKNIIEIFNKKFIINSNGKIKLTEENTDYGRGNLFKVNGYANNFNNADVTLSFTDGVDYSDYVDLH